MRAAFRDDRLKQMARPRKPTALKLLAGKPGHHPLPKEREVDNGPAVKPDYLNVLASPVWDELAPKCIRMGLLNESHVSSFAQLCTYIGQFRFDRSVLTSAELVDMRYLRAAFGLEPSGQAKAGIATGKPAKQANPFAELG